MTQGTLIFSAIARTPVNGREPLAQVQMERDKRGYKREGYRGSLDLRTRGETNKNQKDTKEKQLETRVIHICHMGGVWHLGVVSQGSVRAGVGVYRLGGSTGIGPWLQGQLNDKRFHGRNKNKRIMGRIIPFPGPWLIIFSLQVQSAFRHRLASCLRAWQVM